jgi:hypothetical protein
MAKQRYEGSCHCAQVRFVVHGDLATAALCNCSICTKKGFVHFIVPPADFELLAGLEALATYQFGTKIAKHHFCKICGVPPFYIPRSDPNSIDVNVRCLAGVDVERLELPCFDGQNWEQANAAKVPWR